ncbi:MAG: GNAT family N-acetyltransferase [Actinomycetota bacterium]|nr:GNAT family N-acetyltransferase [Actinomycetota bacterium]
MSTRPITEGDMEAVAALAGEDEAALQGRPSRLGLNDVRGWLERVDLAQDSWAYEENDKLVAVSWFDFIDDLGFFVGIVAQGAKGRSLGARIVETGEARARERGAARLQTFGLEQDTAAAALFKGHGFATVRRFYEMAIELEAPPVVPTLPEGFTLDTFQTEDARPYYEALDAAFQDHWEHHAVGFDKWWELRQSAHDFDPTLWFLIRDGDEVAAVVRNEPDRNGGGYVGAIGVQRAWRGKGLGRALLLRTFAEFYARGVPRVTLGVDAESPTGATKLYESVGMTVENAAVVYEKALA